MNVCSKTVKLTLIPPSVFAIRGPTPSVPLNGLASPSISVASAHFPCRIWHNPARYRQLIDRSTSSTVPSFWCDIRSYGPIPIGRRFEGAISIPGAVRSGNMDLRGVPKSFAFPLCLSPSRPRISKWSNISCWSFPLINIEFSLFSGNGRRRSLSAREYWCIEK